MADQGGPLLYHEKQVAALCGQHCLNSLLQGPYFTEVDLAQIAHELDTIEQGFMAESGMDSKDYLAWRAEESGNVAEDGMFSIQVLSKALENWDVSCVNLHSPECVKSLEHPETEQAFICNFKEHWLTIRKIADSWYNFNSLYPAPEYLGTLYLTAFLATLREKGYSIFVIKGQLPRANFDAKDYPGRWFTADEARSATKKAVQSREAGYLNAALGSVLDKASQNGGMLTLKPPGNSGNSAWGRKRPWQSSQASQDNADNDMARAIAASLGQEPDLGVVVEEEDPELAAALAASLADSQTSAGPQAASEEDLHAAQLATLDPGSEPPSGPGVIDIAFRLPDGERTIRRFRQSDNVQDLLNFLRWKGISIEGHQLSMFPNKILQDRQQRLSVAGISNMETLTLKPKR